MLCGSGGILRAGWAAKARPRSGRGRSHYRRGSADGEKKSPIAFISNVINRRLIMGTADGEVLTDGRLIIPRTI